MTPTVIEFYSTEDKGTENPKVYEQKFKLKKLLRKKAKEQSVDKTPTPAEDTRTLKSVFEESLKSLV